jgi:hypothetical protein
MSPAWWDSDADTETLIAAKMASRPTETLFIPNIPPVYQFAVLGNGSEYPALADSAPGSLTD